MNFELNKAIVFFDIESTGLNVIRDRIVQIALIKFLPNKEEPEELEMLLNPSIPISEESIAIHGITPSMVANKPTFRQVADKLFEWIGDADLGGYNSNRFDIPMLVEEFARSGYDFDLDNRNLIDVQRIFYKMEPRTLKAAYKMYCDKDLEDAHDALADVRATVDVLKGQLEHYKDIDYVDGDGNKYETPVKNDMNALHEFTNDLHIVDVTQKLKFDNEGRIVFNFGKYINKPVGQMLANDMQYFHWIQDKEFTHHVKKIVKKELNDYLKANSNS